MPSADRAQALENLEKGTITVATSCGVLIEGFDEPSVDCILMCRPTKSKPLYIQAVGRGLRKNGPLKANCLVLDFQDQNHDLNSIVTLSATIPEAQIEVDGQVKTFNQNENNNAIHSDIIEITDHEFNLLDNTQFAWVDIGDNEYSLLADDNKAEIIISSFGNGYVADLYCQKETFAIVKTPLPLNYCTGVCEDFARNSLSASYADMNRPWLKDNSKSNPSISQINILQQNGINYRDMNKAQASLTIRKIFALERKCIRNKTSRLVSEKQKAFLAKYGVDTNNINRAQAIGLISRIIEEEQNVRN
jgi:ATP-dependent helicase IRC3